MQSMCVECNKLYNPKDFIDAKKRLCPGCAKMTDEREKMIEVNPKKNEPVRADAQRDAAKHGLARQTYIPKPDDNFNQHPPVWAK